MRAATKFTIQRLAEAVAAVAECQQCNCSFAVDVFAALSSLSLVTSNVGSACLAVAVVIRQMGSDWS